MKCVGEDHGVCQCLWGLRRARLFLFVHILASSVLHHQEVQTWAKARRNWNCKTSFVGLSFFQRETSSSLVFLKTPDKAQITVDFSIGKRASAKLWEKWRFLSTPSWRRVSLHKRPPPATSPPTLQVLKHLALLKRKRQHYHHQRFQAR